MRISTARTRGESFADYAKCTALDDVRLSDVADWLKDDQEAGWSIAMKYGIENDCHAEVLTLPMNALVRERTGKACEGEKLPPPPAHIDINPEPVKSHHR